MGNSVRIGIKIGKKKPRELCFSAMSDIPDKIKISKFNHRLEIQHGWAFKELKGFLFEAGVLLDCTDFSDKAELYRKTLGMRGKEGRIVYPDDDSLFFESGFSSNFDTGTKWTDQINL